MKKSRGYKVSSICDATVKVATKILEGKVMQSCHTNEVSVPIVVLAHQSAKGFQFNWSNYLRIEFLENCHEAQEKRKMFHYAWLLLSIVLIA